MLHDTDNDASLPAADLTGWHLLEISPDCVKLLSADSRILSMNDNGLCAMEIDDVGTVAGQSWKALWPAQNHADIDRAIAAARAGGTGSFKGYCPTAKGTPKWWDVIVTAVPGQHGREPELLAISRDMTAAHQAERTIQANEARLRAIVQATSTIVWTMNAAGLVDSEQPAWESFTGQRFDAYRAAGWLDAVHPDDRAGTLEAWRQALSTLSVGEAAHRLRSADGRYVHMNVRFVPSFDGTGAVLEWLGVHADVSAAVASGLEREHLLKELQAANERMSDIFRQAPAFMCVLRGPEHVFELINDRYRQLVGNRDLIGQPIRQALPEVDGQGYFELLDRVYRTGEPFTGADLPVTLQRGAGMPLEERFVDLVYMPLRDADGRIAGLLVHGVDQTERKLAELAQLEGHERLLLATDAAQLGLWSWQPGQDTVTWENQRLYEIFGVPPAEGPVSGERFVRDFLHPDDRAAFEDAFRIVQETGHFSFVGRIYRRDGALRWVEYFGRGLRDEADAPLRLVGTISDITERRQAADTLRKQAEDLAVEGRRKTEFLATLAHELRNPLAPIRSGLSVLRLGGDSGAAVARVRGMMERQVGHMVRLIDDLLDIARISGGKLELKKVRADLNAVLSSAVETSLPMIEAGKHELHVDVAEPALQAEVDATRIAQVVANLLNNAAKYTPAGGRIALSMRRDGDLARITVADNGVGIPADALAGVFDMFSQIGSSKERSQGGLGIGLSLVRRLVEMHGGSVMAASPGAGRGSVFTVTLPLAGKRRETPAEARERHAATTPAPGGIEVLVVDDNVDAALALSMTLELHGHVARIAHDGVDALARVEHFKPRLAFLDIGMPRMNGYDTARAMRRVEGLEQVCLVALTGWGTEEDRSQSSDAGFDFHLTKPVQMADIERILSSITPQ